MAGKHNFEGFEPIFGEAAAEWDSATPAATTFATHLRPFLFYAHSPDASRLQIVASDFHSLSWELTLTVQQLDDLRDDIGIGGSWSEFIHYLIESLSSGDVKLILGGRPNATADSGVARAKLIAHKSKGLPRISLPLSRLVDSSSSGAMANLSLALYRKYKNTHDTVLKGSIQVAEDEVVDVAVRIWVDLRRRITKQEKNESLQKQLDALSFLSKRKVSKPKVSDKATPVSDDLSIHATSLASVVPENSETTSTKDPQPTRVSQRALTINRRAKGRGVSLQGASDSDDK